MSAEHQPDPEDDWRDDPEDWEGETDPPHSAPILDEEDDSEEFPAEENQN